MSLGLLPLDSPKYEEHLTHASCGSRRSRTQSTYTKGRLMAFVKTFFLRWGLNNEHSFASTLISKQKSLLQMSRVIILWPKGVWKTFSNRAMHMKNTLQVSGNIMVQYPLKRHRTHRTGYTEEKSDYWFFGGWDLVGTILYSGFFMRFASENKTFFSVTNETKTYITGKDIMQDLQKSSRLVEQPV